MLAAGGYGRSEVDRAEHMSPRVAALATAKLSLVSPQVDLLTSAFGQIGPLQNVRLIRDKGGRFHGPKRLEAALAPVCIDV